MKEAIPASWRGVTGPDPKTGDVGISFETDQGVLRLRLTLESATGLAGGLADRLRPLDASAHSAATLPFPDYLERVQQDIMDAMADVPLSMLSPSDTELLRAILRYRTSRLTRLINWFRRPRHAAPNAAWSLSSSSPRPSQTTESRPPEDKSSEDLHENRPVPPRETES